MYKSIVLSVALYGSETWVSSEMWDMEWRYLGKWLREEYLDLREMNDRNYTIRSFMIFSSSSNIIRVVKSRRISKVVHIPDTREI